MRTLDVVDELQTLADLWEGTAKPSRVVQAAVAELTQLRAERARVIAHLAERRSDLDAEWPADGTSYHCSSCSCRECRHAQEDCVCSLRAHIDSAWLTLNAIEQVLDA